MSKNTMKNKLAALAVGAPLVTMGFVGLGAGPAAAATTDGADVLENAVGTVSSSTGDRVNVYDSPSAASNIVETFEADDNLLVAAWATEESPWHTVYLDPNDLNTVGYVSTAIVNVSEDFEGTYGLDEETTEDEWDIDDTENGETTDEEAVEEGDVFIIEDDEENLDGVVEDWDNFTEEDVNSGEVVEIESGFVGGENSSPAGLALLASAGLLLVGGGAYALMRREDVAVNSNK